MEPAGGPCSLHGLLACFVCSSDLLVLQHTGSAGLEGEASLSLLNQVINWHLPVWGWSLPFGVMDLPPANERRQLWPELHMFLF